MIRDKFSAELLSDFMRYLASSDFGEEDRLPPLTELSPKLGLSIASLREQLEVARALGLVEVRPRTGIRRLPYTFRPAVMQSLAYSIYVHPESFELFSDFRSHIETAYWHRAVALLNRDDHQELRALIQRAKDKLKGNPPQIPQQEHRELHLAIYKRLDNPFVTGALEAYWEMYEAVGLNVFTDLAYQERVWSYHEKMVEAIVAGNFNAGFQALTEHMDLIYQRSKPATNQKFE